MTSLAGQTANTGNGGAASSGNGVGHASMPLNKLRSDLRQMTDDQ